MIDNISGQNLAQTNSELNDVPQESLNQQSPLQLKNSPEESLSPTPAPEPKNSVIKRIGIALLALLLLGGGGYLITHSNSKSKTDQSAKQRSRSTPVSVATVTQQAVPIQLQAFGNVTAYSTVAVTPQAGGQITGIFFRKGQGVKKGQLLFTLDDRTQAASIQQAQGTLAKDQALVQQAKANLAKDQGLIEQARSTLSKDQGLVRSAQANLAKDAAQSKYTQAQSDRYNRLYKQGAVSQDQAQLYSANSLSAAATLQADQEAISNARDVVRGDQVAIKNAEEVVKGDLAAIQNAQAVLAGDEAAFKNTQVQSSYTKIYSPINGRAGDILVNQGNVVQANNSTPLVKINQTNPIQVTFSVPETNLHQIQKYASNNKLPVSITFPNDPQNPIKGELTFVNNVVDTTTGTIQLIGVFANPEDKLVPGQYVQTTLTLTTIPNAIVVPSQAVQTGPKGQFVFVVKPDNTVENIPVNVSSTFNNLSVIESGLQPNQTVVTDGQANLVPGATVKVQSGAKKSAGDSFSESF